MSSVEGEHAVCTECGQHSELRLPRRFPHICTDCLFPVPDPDSESQEDALPANMRVKESLADALAQRASGFKYEKPFGHKGTDAPRPRE